jgi:hypothetical protein
VLAGKFGTYKSFVSVSWACSLATGKPWLGHDIIEPGPVVYIAAEGAGGLTDRIKAWESVHNRGRAIPDDRLAVVGGAAVIANDDDMFAISELCAQMRPRMVIWDTLHRSAPGIEENSNTEMGVIIDRISRFREHFACTQLFNHHTGHRGDRGRGASAIEDDFDNAWVIKMRDPENRSPKNPRTMEHRKIKDGATAEPVPIRLALCEVSATIERDEDRADETQWIVEQRIKDLATRCDAAGIPAAFGRDKLVAAAAQAGITGASNDLWSQVVRHRKAA